MKIEDKVSKLVGESPTPDSNVEALYKSSRAQIDDLYRNMATAFKKNPKNAKPAQFNWATVKALRAVIAVVWGKLGLVDHAAEEAFKRIDALETRIKELEGQR